MALFDSLLTDINLCSLAVVNMNKTTKVDSEDVQRVVSADAQLHSMESYINPDVNTALCFKPSHAAMVGDMNSREFPEPEDVGPESGDSLGVALIQPVTAGLEFCETNRDLFPTKRSVFVNIEPVSTMLSFEDLNLIETVLARFSSTRSDQTKKGEVGGQDLSTTSDLSMFPALTSSPLGIGNLRSSDEYDVRFTTHRLGLGLKTNGAKVVVNSIQRTDHEAQIEIGDQLVSIEGRDCCGLLLDTVVHRLSESPRPITLRFFRERKARSERIEVEGREKISSTARKSSENISSAAEPTSFLVSSFQIKFKKGQPPGFQLERSACGNFPVVMKVFPSVALAAGADDHVDESNSEQIEATFERSPPRIPRPGAIVVGVNGIAIRSSGVDEVWAQIAKVADNAPTNENDVDGVYSLSFLEVDSKLWGNVDTIDVSSSGFALSFIDDLHGRDMPLFRGKLNALEIHAQRGLGGRAQIIEIETSSILNLGGRSSSSKESALTLSQQEFEDLKSETVITISGIAVCSVDYFHPRIAFWEPLVEPSQLFLLLEKQAGSKASTRPGQVAVEISDRLLREQSFRGNITPSVDASSKIVSLNVTDASAQVAVKAMSQWKEWRKTKVSSMDDEAESDEAHHEPEIELRESNPLPNEDSALATPTNGAPFDNEELFLESPTLDHAAARKASRRDSKRDAAQRAAQAALIFAQKRGADSSKKGDSAKPFVLRNRTGVSIAFVQGNSGSSVSRESGADESHLSVVGEYAGLAEFDPLFIKELADMEEARFSMEILSETSRVNSNTASSSQQPSNKIRNYEGRFPSLTIAIQAVSGVSIDPLVDLQVFKVGSTVRHLLVKKVVDQTTTENNDPTDYSIPVVWKVEIEDNRRVLTLSTAVRVVTTAFGAQMEIGVQKMTYDDPFGKQLASSQAIKSIGIARPESPLYLPLWLALKLEAVSIFVRPRAVGTSRYEWGRSSILRFAPLLSIDGGADRHEDAGTWVWEETFGQLDYLRCDAVNEGGRPVWLAVFSGSSASGTEQMVGSKTGKASTMNYEEEHHEVISVALDSNVTLRNMLPMSIDWQVAHVLYGSASMSIVDGSPLRSVASTAGDNPSLHFNTSLRSGECTEVFACDFDSSSLQARFREPDGQNWSSWAPLALHEPVDYGDNDMDDDDASMPTLFPRTRQVNVQVTNDSFGVPLTFGVRIVPKTTLGTLDEPVATQIYGIEIIVYAELWLRNLTSLPLNFGCPSYQLHGMGTSPAEILDATATRFNAESALMEIASLLEVGDKGTGLNKKAAREVASTGAIESLPNQECAELWEEVFEYLEISFSTVKRRWWASESFDSFRMNITQSDENGRWNWIGESWVSDTGAGMISNRVVLSHSFSPTGSRSTQPVRSILLSEGGRVVETYWQALGRLAAAEHSILRIPFAVEGIFATGQVIEG